MAKRNSRNTRGRIISAAWKLFYEQGYDGTTVEDIVFESGTSKGSFYHYFDGKDALMGTLAYVFDEKYEDLMPTLDPEKGAIETLAYINHELYVMIESSRCFSPRASNWVDSRRVSRSMDTLDSIITYSSWLI